MLNLAQLLQRVEPQTPRGGRIVHVLGPDEITSEQDKSMPKAKGPGTLRGRGLMFLCRSCGGRFGDDGFYWRVRNSTGTESRYTQCKACHCVKTVADQRQRAVARKCAL